jgi:oligosaccharyl transferase (archaeosortase A-associated)
MNLSKSRTSLVIAGLIVIFFAISLIFRVALPYDSVFTGGWVKFTSNDAYFHMRMVDSIVQNFPHLTHFDPYFIFPGGATTSGVHFMDYFLATIIWIIGMGSPSQHLIDVIAAWFPSVLAALTVIPVFFIGKALFNRWVGVMAAFLVAILPGEFLGRSILAFTDNHVVETFFSTIFAMFLILAIKEAGKGQLTLGNLLKFDWKAVRKPLIFAVLAGAFLGLYLITWAGALLFVFIASVYFVLQFIINQFRHKPNDYLGIIGFVVFLVAALFFLPQSPGRNFSLTIIAALLIPLVLAAISIFMSRMKLAAYFYPLALAGAGAVLFGILYVVSPTTISTMWSNFLFIFAPGGGSTATTTMEMQPFLSPQGTFSTAVAWGNFTTSFFLVKGVPIPGFGLIALAILIVLAIKQRGEQDTHIFFIIWSLIILFATLSERRFAYYLVVNIAVLSAYISWQIIWYAGLRRVKEKAEQKAAADAVKAENPKTKTKNKKKKAGTTVIPYYYAGMIAAIIVVFFLVDFFNFHQSNTVASQVPYAPSDGWEQALTWMQTNTPEPLGDKAAYDKLYDSNYKYPASAYGVSAWWDYGYWIERIARRLPSTNPSQFPVPITKVANLFLSQNVTSTDKMMADLQSKYVIADNSLIVSKLWAVIDWAGQDQGKYFATYYVSNNNQYQAVQLYTLDFYRMLVVRLYSFDGKAVPDGKPVVVTYTTQTKNGQTFKLVSKADNYPSYQAALNFIATQKTGNYDIVGTNPFVSPIPQDAVTDFNLVYSSPATVSFSGNFTIPDIKVFEHVK